MSKAIQKEVRDMFHPGSFKVILKEEIPDGTNVHTARHMLAIKSRIDGEIKFKAR